MKDLGLDPFDGYLCEFREEEGSAQVWNQKVLDRSLS